MRLRRGLGRILLAGLALIGQAACGGGGSASRQPPERREIILQTQADDQRAGEEGSREVEEQIGILDAPELTRYVREVGQRVARHAPRGRFPYRFRIVDQDAPNAFALPGGFIFVSRGLLALSNSEAELANVLGHEIVHAARRHAAARQSLIQGIPGLLRFAALGQVAAYGRDQEREADRLGQGLSALAGFDPQGMSDFLRHLESTERLRHGAGRTPGFLDTHPATGERVASTAARAQLIRWRPPPGPRADGVAYLKRLDGLVVGTAASEGVVEGDRFLHPDLGFSLRFPPGWQVINTRLAVGALSPRRDAQVVFQYQGQGEDPEQASLEFLEKAREQGLRDEPGRPVKLGELAAFRVVGRARFRGASLGVMLTWIARDGAIFRITGVSARVSGHEGLFRNVVRSFRPLSTAQRAAIRESRLRVVQARGGESLAQLSKRTGNSWNLQQTAVMNALFADALLESGAWVKIAVSRPYQSASAHPHRVVDASGRVSSRSERELERLQRVLLEREGIEFDATGRISLARFRWQPRLVAPTKLQ